MSENQYFRAGSGTVIYNNQNQILLFSRADKPEIWQLQQGGMDSGESIKETLVRELLEETALTLEDIEKVDLYPTWLSYEYPPEIKGRITDQNCLGQIHQWYFLKLKPDIVVDITKAQDKEFIACRWSTFDELLTQADVLKHSVYTTLYQYFKTRVI